MFLNYNLNLPLDIYLYYLLQDTFCKYSKSIAKDTCYSLWLVCVFYLLSKYSCETKQKYIYTCSYLRVADIDECSELPSVCQNGATCRNSFGTFSCECMPGWEGTNCETSEDSESQCKQLWYVSLFNIT